MEWVRPAAASRYVAQKGKTAFDLSYRAHVASRPCWFYLVPAIVATVSLGTALGLGKTGVVLVIIGNTGWLLYHFTKQNWGLLCLSASATGAPRPLRAERRLYVAGAVGGTIGSLKPLLPAFSGDWAQTLGLCVVAGVGLIATGLAVRRLVGG